MADRCACDHCIRILCHDGGVAKYGSSPVRVADVVLRICQSAKCNRADCTRTARRVLGERSKQRPKVIERQIATCSIEKSSSCKSHVYLDRPKYRQAANVHDLVLSPRLAHRTKTLACQRHMRLLVANSMSQMRER